MDSRCPAWLGIATWLFAFASLHGQNQSALVFPGLDGRLVYEGYANEGQSSPGNRMIDFSHAGYRGGGVAIPWVPEEIVLDPLPGDDDDHARIQAAIDALAELPLSPAGFRGALLLRAGAYRVSQTLRITSSGIIIRGEGQHTGGTVIQYTATTQSNLFNFFGSGGWTKIANTETPITDTLVPSGTRSFNVASTAGLSVGDRLMVHRTPNQAWIDLLQMGQYGWTPAAYRSQTPRVITAIDGNTITVDASLVHAIESQYGGGEVYRYHFNGALRQVGIENIRLESSFTSDTDEDHGWNAVVFSRVENGWARRVTARHFGYSCVTVTGGSKFITLEDSAQLDPKSIITGGRRYSFNIGTASFILVQRGYTREGRHDYVTGARVPGPNVFVDSLAENVRSDIGPHHRYAEGLLFDNVRGGAINVQNRRSSGTGHGWAGAQTVFWNCHASSMICDAPKAAMNFAIGCIGTQRQGQWQPGEPDGIWESRGVPVTPRSLYYTQLADRLGRHAVATVTSSSQQQGTIWTELSAWKGNADAPGLPAFAPLGVDAGPDLAAIATEALDLRAVIRHPLPENFPTTVHTWSQLAGPASVGFDDASSAAATATFPTPGVYKLQFAVSQDDDRDPQNVITYSDADTVTITVTAPPDAIAALDSVGRIIGRRQDNADPLGYYPNSTNRFIGVGGSNANLTRLDRIVVLSYTLPDLPPGSTLAGATLQFEIRSKNNHSGADPGLEVYLLDTADPTGSGVGFFYHGAADPNPAVARVGGIRISEPQGSEITYSPGTHVPALTLGGEALSLLQELYGSGSTPSQPSVFFRFNLDNLIVGSGNANLDGSTFDRYQIDIGPETSRLALFAIPAANTFANWIAGFDVGGLIAPDDDPDGDGIPNAVEHFFGTHPGEFSQGLVPGVASGGTFTFTHPQNSTPADHLTAAYTWSTDLDNFHANGAEANGTTVTITTEADTPESGLTTVTATSTGTSPNRLFLRIGVTVD